MAAKPHLKNCIICGKEFDYGKHKITQTCSKDCQKLLMKQKKDLIQEKRKITYAERYGSRIKNCVTCGKEFDTGKHKEKLNCSIECLEIYQKKHKNERMAATFSAIQKKYGVKTFPNTEGFSQKIKNVNQKKYGVDYAIQLDEYKEKQQKTNFKKYGANYAWQSEDAKAKNIDKMKTRLEQENIVFDFGKYNGIFDRANGILKPIRYDVKCTKCNKIVNINFTLQGVKCPYCTKKSSKNQNELKHFIEDECGITDYIENSFSIIKPMQIDFHIDRLKLAIEFNGNYYHTELNANRNSTYHITKTKLCNDKNIKLIHIFEDEWIYKKDIVKNRLKNLLGVSSVKIYGRKCRIEEINSKIKNSFLNENHLQGAGSSIINLGLYHGEALVSVMTFSKPRLALGAKKYNYKDNVYELTRFCSKKDYNIVGGFSKLMNHFIKNYIPNSIYSYADCRWSGINPLETVYSKNGFKYISTSKPSYFYVKIPNFHLRYHRFSFTKRNLLKLFTHETSDLTEWEIAQRNGLDRIWDCGAMKFEWTKP